MDLTAEQRTSELEGKSVDKLVWGTERVKMENSEKSDPEGLKDKIVQKH